MRRRRVVPGLGVVVRVVGVQRWGYEFRAVLDACRLAEETAFAYKNLSDKVDIVLGLDGSAARDLADPAAVLCRRARRGHDAPDWWTWHPRRRSERRALDPADELGLDFAEHIGAPDGATRRASCVAGRRGGTERASARPL